MALGPRHRKLLNDYVRDLNRAADIARARPAESRRSPLASDPIVLGVIIQYFFLCQRLNEAIAEEGGDDEVEPLTFVHEMLTGTYQDLWKFIAELPYLPLGLRRDDTRV
jgi:hypothetical protein